MTKYFVAQCSWNNDQAYVLDIWYGLLRTLCHKIFSHYRAGPSAGHMVEYNTPFRPRNRFFWSGLHKYVKAWVNGCTHFISYNMWHTWKRKFYFSWTDPTPLYIMHLDIWSPGTISNDSGKTISLITAMCNLILFVIPFLLDQFTLHSVDTTFI